MFLRSDATSKAFRTRTFLERPQIHHQSISKACLRNLPQASESPLCKLRPTPRSSFRLAYVLISHSSPTSGAGLGGLFLALFLQKNCPHIRVDIYESAHELTEVGAGIGMFPRVWEILKTLDIEEDLVTVIGAANGQSMSRPLCDPPPKFVSLIAILSTPSEVFQVRRA